MNITIKDLETRAKEYASDYNGDIMDGAVEWASEECTYTSTAWEILRLLSDYEDYSEETMAEFKDMGLDGEYSSIDGMISDVAIAGLTALYNKVNS